MGLDPITQSALIVGGSSLYGAKKSKDAAKDAARAQMDASAQGIEFQREALEALRGDLDPFRQFGGGALTALQQQLGIAPQVEQFRINEKTPQAQELAQQRYDEYMGTGGFIPEDMRGAYTFLSGLGNSPEQIQEILRAGDRGGEIEDLKTLEDFQQEAYKEFNIPDPSQPGNIGEAAGQQQQMQARQNPLLEQAMAERAAYDPLNNPLLARAQQERLDFDPLSNPLLASASEKTMSFDPMANIEGALQNPLLKAMQDDVTRRLMANQAARGKLGSGGTAEALQQRLVPQALQFGMQMNELQRQDIADRARLGGTQVGLQQAAMMGREGLGYGLDELQRAGTTGRLQAGLSQEDLAQRDIANLMDAARMGQASAAQSGLAGQSAASQMGNLSLAAGQASAAGSLGRAQAINQGIGGLTGAALYGLGSFTPGAGGTFNTNFSPTTSQSQQYLGF
jgi:hypothetical protein